MKLWAENLQLQRKEWKIWEEDRFLPVMQIGELPDKTCLSYKTGMYRKCLLSCFDSNKKIIYISYQGKIVLRAILRLTKASEEKMERENKEFQFRLYKGYGKERETRATGSVFGKSLCKRDFRQ